jgi:hypothetical protein
MPNVIEEDEEFTPEEARFRFDACLKKALGKPLTEAEREVVRDVNRRNGWDKPTK